MIDVLQVLRIAGSISLDVGSIYGDVDSFWKKE